MGALLDPLSLQGERVGGRVLRPDVGVPLVGTLSDSPRPLGEGTRFSAG